MTGELSFFFIFKVTDVDVTQVLSSWAILWGGLNCGTPHPPGNLLPAIHYY